MRGVLTATDMGVPPELSERCGDIVVGFGSRLRARSQGACELEAVLQQPQVHVERGRGYGVDFRDDAGEVVTLDGGRDRLAQLVERTNGDGGGVAGGPGDGGEVGAARGRRRRASGREEALVIEDDVDQV